MQIIKKTIFTVIIFCFTLNNSYSVPVKNADEKTYYWFSIELYEYEWEAGILLFNVNRNIKKGDLKEFKKQIRKKLKTGNILIGPFGSEKEVKNAVKIYKYIYADKKEKKYNNDKDYLFFNIQLKEKKNTGIFKIIERKTGVYASNIESFETNLLQNLKESILLIGPFNTDCELSNSKLLKLYSKKRSL